MFKKSQIYLLIGLLFLIIIFFSILIFSGGKNTIQEIPSPSPIPIFSPSSTFRPLEIKPILTEDVPMIPEPEGGGVNSASTLVQESQSEVAKILPFLPYENSFTGSSGKTISILIPNAQFQTTPWVLEVQIFGINYHAIEADTNYNLQKDSFLVAASNVFEWLKAIGVNPEKVIINWGDRAYIRENAEKWLSE